MKKIRATITVDLPYDDELLTHGGKLDAELKRVLTSNFISCTIQSGELEASREPVIYDKNQHSTDRRIS